MVHALSHFYSHHMSTHDNLRSFFKLDGYECFDIDKGKDLVEILIDLMKKPYQKDELKSCAASLLFDIYNVGRARGMGREEEWREERLKL